MRNCELDQFERLQTIADLGLLIAKILKRPSIWVKKVGYTSAIQHPISKMDILLAHHSTSAPSTLGFESNFYWLHADFLELGTIQRLISKYFF